MEHGACNVVYTNRRAYDEHVRKETLSRSLIAQSATGTAPQGYFPNGKSPPADMNSNVELILSIFNQVHICGSGQSCLNKIAELLESTTQSVPLIVLIDIPYDEEQRLKRLSREPRTPSPTATRVMRSDAGEPDDIYGIHLLTHVYSEIQSQNFSKLVIPVVVLSGLERKSQNALSSQSITGPQLLTDTVRLARYLDAGAVDVMSSPLSKDNVHALAVHAYRIHKEVARAETTFLTTKRNRKLSWVGVSDAKPYAYLREAMVSSLMSGICNPETVGDSLDSNDLYVSEDRHEAVAAAIGSWSFSAHDFTDDELLLGALLMLKHALQMPELEQWRMSDDDLIIFLLASRTAYNEFVLYHNFRHVSDVLQALFYFLVQIGTLPPYPPGSAPVAPAQRSPISQLLGPFDALTLLISAIGHDVGHPGVNNAFLVALNAPLAQLYNDRSVLESFHCAAYSQILRRYWPKAFSDCAMRNLMINSILATDMGLHFKYMTDLGQLQEKLEHDNGLIDSWNAKVREERKDLACGLLIKCADISNVARKFEVAARWANILTDEFSNQGVMEQELQIPSCLFGGPPVRDDIIKLGESQIGFINIFARPLFEGVTYLLPAMGFAVEEMSINKSTWDDKIQSTRQQMKENPRLHLGALSSGFAADPSPSPFSGPPLKQVAEVAGATQLRLGPNALGSGNGTTTELTDRRGSNGSIGAHPSTSHNAALGIDKSTSIPGTRSPASLENQSQSRRGSVDPNMTTILITQSPNPTDKSNIDGDADPVARSTPPSRRKDTLPHPPPKKASGKSADEMENGGVRPLTAPSSARRSQGKSPNPHNAYFFRAPRPFGIGPDDDSANNLHPLPHLASQSQSEVDLCHTVNGAADGSKPAQWDATNHTADSHVSRPDTFRDSSRRSEWWRLSSRRRTRDVRNGDTDTGGQQKEVVLDPSMLQANADATSPTSSSPCRNSKTEKLKTFFKRKAKNNDDQEKQLSSFGSSSQLRTPPTSDPGRSVNSDD